MNLMKKQRKNIDSIDKKIIKLLSKRLSAAKKLKRIKKQQSLKMMDRAREREVIENARTMAKQHDIDPEFAEGIFKKIVKYMREKQG